MRALRHNVDARRETYIAARALRLVAADAISMGYLEGTFRTFS
jgi:hypothetical protein